MNLSEQKCVACEGGMPPLTENEIMVFKPHVDKAWVVSEDNKHITREFTFINFKEAMVFVNRVADIAELEGHHPDIRLYSYKNVSIDLWTHALNGLSENDFIVASKIDRI